MSRRTALAAISPVASAQWGMITAGQARRLDVSRQDVNRLVNDGTLTVTDQAARVYRLSGVPEDPDLDPLRAAWLQLGVRNRGTSALSLQTSSSAIEARRIYGDWET